MFNGSIRAESKVATLDTVTSTQSHHPLKSPSRPMSSEQTRRTSHHTRMPSLETLSRPISPPPPRNPPPSDTSTTRDKAQSSKVAAAAAIEAGIFQIRDHLSYFSNHFDRIARPRSSTPRLSLDRFRALYLRNQHDRGRHFVVHQHDHPVAGRSDQFLSTVLSSRSRNLLSLPPFLSERAS